MWHHPAWHPRGDRASSLGYGAPSSHSSPGSILEAQISFSIFLWHCYSLAFQLQNEENIFFFFGISLGSCANKCL